ADDQPPDRTEPATPSVTSSASLATTRAHATEPTTTKFDDSCPTISPRALRVAQQLGVDWKEIRGTGSTGRIRERDVRAHFERSHVADRPQSTSQRQAAATMGGRT